MTLFSEEEASVRRYMKPNNCPLEEKDDEQEEAPKDAKKIEKRLERLEMASTMQEDRIASTEAWATRTRIMAKTEKLETEVLMKRDHQSMEPKFSKGDKDSKNEVTKIFIENVQKEVRNPARFGEISMQFAMERVAKLRAKEGEEKKEAKSRDGKRHSGEQEKA